MMSAVVKDIEQLVMERDNLTRQVEELKRELSECKEVFTAPIVFLHSFYQFSSVIFFY